MRRRGRKKGRGTEESEGQGGERGARRGGVKRGRDKEGREGQGGEGGAKRRGGAKRGRDKEAVMKCPFYVGRGAPLRPTTMFSGAVT